MQLTLTQKSELDALVNFFGGSDNIMADYKNDRTHRRLRQLGLIRWQKADKPYGRNFLKLTATKLGTEVAKRFKVSWSQRWADLHPETP